MMLSGYDAVGRQSPPIVAFHDADSCSVLHRAFVAAPYGVVVSGEDGTIHFVNAAASEIFAYSPDELIGQPFSRLLADPAPESHKEEWQEFWKSPVSGSTIPDCTIAGIRRGGVRVPLAISLNALTDGPTHYVIASMVDISERLDLEARLAAATNAHLGFQRLIADVAVRLGAVDPDSVDDVVVDCLRQIGEVLQFDGVALWRWKAGDAVAIPTHHWAQAPCPVLHDSVPLTPIPFVITRLKEGEGSCFATVDELPDPTVREMFRRHGLRSGAVIPLEPQGDAEDVPRALTVGSTTREQQWPQAIIQRLRLVASVMSQAFARRTSHTSLLKAQDEIRRLRDRLASENVELRREAKVLRLSRSIVSESAALQQVIAQVELVAPTPSTVLLLGETGTGKEVMAQAVHDMSPRRQRPMIRVSCAAIPTALIESELFGRERGAYTGALSRQIGRFEAANQSTLFLDEIGDLPMEVQIKLLRVLQERVIERLGSTQPIKVDVRIIAATNRNLEDAVRDKTFREDLFYRLNVFPIVVPPLRERVEDIPALVWSFIDEFSRSFGKTIESISKESMRELQRYPWPGNVRELRNVIERAIIVATSPQLVVPAPRIGQRSVPQAAMTLFALEVDHIRSVLESSNWRVRGPAGAAERLGLKPTTLESRMARLGITRKRATG